MSIYSRLFDLSAYAIAGASYYLVPSGVNFVSSCFCGVQAFAISSVFDKAVRAVLVKNGQGEDYSARTMLFDPFIEEGIYSGVLLTQSNAWMIPRLLAALFTGTTAARALTGQATPEQNKKWLTLDMKIGFLWAISRELILLTIPQSSIPLILLDSCVFALAEVCPKNEHPGLPKFGPEWSYKVVSSAFFRVTANTVATMHGISASITQHLLFNISQAFQKELTPIEETR